MRGDPVILFEDDTAEEMVKDRVALLLQHFSGIDDEREPWRLLFPLSEVLLLLTCATIAACDDPRLHEGKL